MWVSAALLVLLCALTAASCETSLSLPGTSARSGGFWVLQARDWSPVGQLPADLEVSLSEQLTAAEAAILVPVGVAPYQGPTSGAVISVGKYWEPKTVTLSVYRRGTSAPLLTVSVGPGGRQVGMPRGRVELRGVQAAASADTALGPIRYLLWEEEGFWVSLDLGEDAADQELKAARAWLEEWRWVPGVPAPGTNQKADMVV